MQHDQERREQHDPADLGDWAHFVGDGSQPMHVSVHFNGWGDFPNPRGFTRVTNSVRLEPPHQRQGSSADGGAMLRRPGTVSAESSSASALSYGDENLAVVTFRFYERREFGACRRGRRDSSPERVTEVRGELRDVTDARAGQRRREWLPARQVSMTGSRPARSIPSPYWRTDELIPYWQT